MDTQRRANSAIRPSIPPVLGAALAVFLLARARMGWPEMPLIGIVVTLGSVAAFAGWAKWQKKHLGFVVAVFCALVVVWVRGEALLVAYQQALVTLESTPVSALSVEVTGEASAKTYGWTSEGKAWLDGAYLGKVWLSSTESLEEGSYSFYGRFKPLPENDFGRSSKARGYLGTVSVIGTASFQKRTGLPGLIDSMRKALKRRLNLDESGGALIAGCLLGIREPLRALKVDASFQAAGLAHMIAVSGAHLALMTTLAASGLKHLKLPRLIHALLLVLITGLYVLIAGAPPSAVRAWSMALLANGSVFVNRRAHGLSAAALVSMVLLIADPYMAFELGFLLSVISVTALALFAGWAEHFLEFETPAFRRRLKYLPYGRKVRSLLRTIRMSAGASLVCVIATLPLTASAFGRMSLIAPVANVLIAPLIAPFMGVALVALLLASIPLIGTIVLAVAQTFGAIIVSAVKMLAKVPFASISVEIPSWLLLVGVLILAVVVYRLWPAALPPKAVGAAVLLASTAGLIMLVAAFLQPPRMVMLDIGQGDATLLSSGATHVLIDTGPDEAVVEALTRQGVFSLDAVIITHQHDDHYGGLEHLAATVPIGTVYVAEGVKAALGLELESVIRNHQLNVQELSHTQTLASGAWNLKMIWPHVPSEGLENHESLALIATLANWPGSFRALFTGDLEQDELQHLIDEAAPIDVLKVGHHGSAVSLSSDQAVTLKPKVALISAGNGNSFGHPTEACLAALEAANTQVFCTKDVGDIQVTPKGAAFEVRCRASQGAFALMP